MHSVRRLTRVGVAVVVISLGTLSVSAAVASQRAASAKSWTTVTPLPGVAALSVGGGASTEAVSCPTRSSCVAVGSFTDAHGMHQGFVDSMKSGVWQSATAVAGLAALNVGGGVSFSSVGCSSAGNCSATGEYETKARNFDAFVVNELAGRWHDAERVPGVSGLQGKYVRQLSSFGSMTCVPGRQLDCEMGGSIAGLSSYDDPGPSQAIVDSEVNGVWSVAILVPWPARESAWSNQSWVGAVACPVAGDCTIVVNTGADDYSVQGTFVATETKYKWSAVTMVPGLSVISKDSYSQDLTWGYGLACPSLGNCVDVGTFQDFWVPFHATETSHHWGTATGVTGLSGEYAQALFVACPSVTTCSLVGLHQGVDGNNEYAFESYKVSGRWTAAVDIPGLSSLGEYANVTGFACTTADACVTAGTTTDGSGDMRSFVETSVRGTWANAALLPGAAAAVNGVSCALAGGCVIVGSTVQSVNKPSKAFYSDLAPSS